MSKSVIVGSRAPDFTLVDIEMKPRSLNEFKGKKVVLAFYPGAFTSVCQKEMCTFRDALSNLERARRIIRRLTRLSFSRP